jgi:serine/threonine protein kinase
LGASSFSYALLMTRLNPPSIAEDVSARRSDRSPSPPKVKGWELIELAAGGNLAETYRAQPTGAPPDRPAAYALKVLRRAWQDDARAVGMFRREAQVGQIVRHPHVIAVLAAGVRKPPYFVVTPWLAGCTLADRMVRGWRPDLPMILWTVRQVAEGLDALHVSGWMHGDIKPENIFLSPEGHVTLLDLGFARRPDEAGSVVDRCVAGTCNYIAPEMVTSALRADIRSDLYSLGVVLFEMVAGRLPFQGRDLAELVSQHKQSRAPDLRRLVPHLPTGIIRLTREMLAKEPLRRPQTPRELIDRLASLEILTFAERTWGE